MKRSESCQRRLVPKIPLIVHCDCGPRRGFGWVGIGSRFDGGSAVGSGAAFDWEGIGSRLDGGSAVGSGVTDGCSAGGGPAVTDGFQPGGLPGTIITLGGLTPVTGLASATFPWLCLGAPSNDSHRLMPASTFVGVS